MGPPAGVNEHDIGFSKAGREELISPLDLDVKSPTAVGPRKRLRSKSTVHVPEPDHMSSAAVADSGHTRPEPAQPEPDHTRQENLEMEPRSEVRGDAHDNLEAVDDVNPDDAGDVNFRVVPDRPAWKEVMRHEITHLPFQPWCATCIAARAPNDAHRRRPPGFAQDQNMMPKVAFDYAVFRSRPGTRHVPVLVGVCKQTGLKMTAIVRDKHGKHPGTISSIERGLQEMGHFGPVTLRSDKEPALQDLLKNVAQRRRAATLVEHGPRDDGQANGLAERAIRSVEEHVRVLKRDFEERLSAPIDVQHPLFEWIVRHATDLLNKHGVGVDGRTPHQRLRGAPYRGELLRFGSRVMHRLSGKVRGGVLVDRWHNGHWVGKNASSDEHLVMTDAGTVIRTRAVRGLDKPMEADRLMTIKPPHGIVTTMNLENIDDTDWTRSEPPVRPRTRIPPR